MHVITKAEADYELDREEMHRLYQRYGYDRLQIWIFQFKFHLTPPDCAEPTHDQLMDLR